MNDLKNPYSYFIVGFSFILVDMRFYGVKPDTLPDFIGYAFFIIGIQLLPVFHNLKRWSKNFAIILTVLSLFVELDQQWLGTLLLGKVGEQFMQFMLIVFMYTFFQLLLYMHQNKPLEAKTFKIYQQFMTFMLGAFVIQAFSINIEASIRDTVYFIGSLLQLLSYILFSNYCNSCTKYLKELKKNKVHSLS